MLDGQGYDISCDLVMKVSVGWSLHVKTLIPTQRKLDLKDQYRI